jgi:hypothetical protein
MDMKGLEVTFTDQLMRGPAWVTPGGAVFHFEYLQSFNLEKNTVTLRTDYKALIPLDDDVVVFQSAGIKDLAKDKVLYPEN